MRLINYITSPLLQLTFFSLIPLLTYAIQHRQIRGIADYLGIKRPVINNWQKTSLLFLAAFGLMMVAFGLMSATSGFVYANSPGARLARSGLSLPVLVPAVLLFAFIQTGLSEEILYRSFIAKRLIAWLGFSRGNLLQAVVFSLQHFFTLGAAPVPIRIIHMILAGVVGYIFGYINEREANGSILVSWVCHGLINSVAVIIVMLSGQ